MGWLDRRFGKRKGVYALVNRVDGKVYIGSSTDIKKRSHDHLYLLRHNQHPNPHLQYAFNKYGESAFEMQILQEVASEEELIQIEQYWMDHTQCYDHEYGYNIDLSADRKIVSPETGAKIATALRGRTITDEHRAKLSQALKGRPLSAETRAKMRGRIHTEETRAKIAAAGKGRTLSEQTRAKISAAHKGRVLSEETRAKISAVHKQRVSSEEVRAKMSTAHKGRSLSEQTRAKLSTANKGKIISDETRAKISAARKKKPLSDASRLRIVEASRVLTPEQVQEIWRRLADGEAIRSIAEAYRVNYYTIWNILKRKTWRHLPLPEKNSQYQWPSSA
jgi:group I intron endonuclease